MAVNSNRVDNFETIKIQSEIPMFQSPLEIHKVRLPPQRTTLQKLRHRHSEIFFPDDPFHGFKNQTWVMKLLLALQYLFPIFQWGPEYSFRLFRSDIVSGLTIASLAIPQVCHISRF
jgi:sulfate transporter 3